MEKPILFNTEMVKSILEGRKISTRRPVKGTSSNDELSGYGFWKEFNKSDNTWYVKDYTHACVWWTLKEYISKFGKYHIGDTIWFRETWQESECFDYSIKDQYCYKADNATKEHAEQFNIKWRPSIHMPRVAARIFLKVTDVRLERLRDISEDGAKGEGIRSFTKDEKVYKYSHTDEFVWRDAPRTATEAFKNLWDSIYSKQGNGWEEDPWVWVIEFERMENNEL